MKILTSLALAIALTGCATWKPEQKVVVEQVYIIRIPPADLMTLPPAVTPLDADKADQGDVAKWLVQKEDYTTQLENKLTGIAKFFVDEQGKLKAGK